MNFPVDVSRTLSASLSLPVATGTFLPMPSESN